MERVISLLRFNLVLLAGILVCFILYYGREILILVAFAVLFSMLMNPIANWVEKKGTKRIWSTVICVLLLVFIVSIFIALITAQIQNIGEQSAQIQQKGQKFLSQIQGFVEHQFHLSPQKQIDLLKKHASGMGQFFARNLKLSLAGILGLVGYFVMILVLMFLFLLQREKYKSFFIYIYKGHDHEDAQKVVGDIVNVAHSYLTGMLMSMLLIAILYSIGFLIIGLENAVLLAALAASLIIIPYVGAFIGGVFPFAMALLTEDSFGPALGVIGVMVFVQIIDNNFIEPYVVGGEVKLSAVTSILCLFIGGALWGIPGVMLFLPMTGIVKVIFDHIEPLKPYGYLIGDQSKGKPSAQLLGWVKGIFKKK
ncbi:MAG TPA: AI-2E family transporter [Cytophagaceae bacterium]|jgi:predicted PurR-regulated permease PerM